MKRFLACVLLLCLSCASTENGVVPRPFTAEQIRDANQPGTSLVFRITQPGEPDMHQIMEFGASDGEYVDLGGRMTNSNGKPLGKAQNTRPSWTELRDHATYSPRTTTRSTESVDVPAGKFDCTLYTVRKSDGFVDRFWFAKKRPGPPVLCTTTDSRGEEVFRMELLKVSSR